MAALEAQKARLQQAREAEAARAREEAEVRAAAATAAAMEEAEAKLRRETPPGGSPVETLRKRFEGDASSRMTLDEADTGSSGSSGPTALSECLFFFEWQGSRNAFDVFPWGAGHGTLRWTRASEQAGKALRSQGHQCAHVM